MCDSKECLHPKLCRFFLAYGRCKFFPCSYKHAAFNQVNKDYKNEIKKIEALEESMIVKDKEIVILREMVEESNEAIKKDLENKFEGLKNEETSVKFSNIEINLDTVVANIKDITKEVDLHKLQLDVLKDDVYNYSQLADGLEETVMYMQSDVSACCFTLQLLRWNTCVDVLQITTVHDSMETSLNHSQIDYQNLIPQHQHQVLRWNLRDTSQSEFLILFIFALHYALRGGFQHHFWKHTFCSDTDFST